MISVMISTMALSGTAVPDRMRLAGHEASFINQCGADGEKKAAYAGNEYTVYDYAEKGLARSRNRALERAEGEYIWMLDDDVTLEADAEATIEKAFADHPGADALLFNIISETEGREQRQIESEHALTMTNSMAYPTYRYVYRLDRLREKGIHFNEAFGSGSKYSSGEDTIFTADCLRAGLNIIAVPLLIGRVRHADSVWFSGFDKKYRHDKGALLKAIFGLKAFAVCAAMLMKHRDWCGDASFVKAYLEMLSGVRKYHS